MTTLSRNIKYYRTKNKLTQKELANKLGIKPTAISAWELGRNKPLMDNVEKMSIIFDISKSELLGDDFQPNIVDKPSPILDIYNELTPPRQTKVYHYAQEQLDEQQLEEHSNLYMIHGRASAAGSAIEVDDNDARMNVVNSSTIPNGADEIVKITGDSMEPLIKKGSSVYIRHQPTIENGEIAIVRIEDIGVTCKKVYKNNQQVRLKSINTTYDDMIFAADEITILGKVLL
ncbi:XRE family transcriptional regulator [Dolosigranulum savutiense]|uniref:XRE family transcriptional regulator n=1 Tax=Dolosigranulum savutiense TaxID=3110288 RepID=A0AB74TPX6_9LACT